MRQQNNFQTQLSQLKDIFHSGIRTDGAVSDLSEGDGTLFFPSDTPGTVAHWIRDTYRLAVDAKHQAFASRLDIICQKYTSERFSVAQLDDLDLVNFARHIFVEESDEWAYADPIDTRYIFQLFVQELLQEVEHAASLQLEPMLADSDYRSIEQIAVLEGVTRKRVIQRVSEYRKAKGRDPLWIRRLPGRQRGFVVHWPSYERELMSRTRVN